MNLQRPFSILISVVLLFLQHDLRAATTQPALERIGLSADKRSLVQLPSGKPFVPWGLNYDRDYKARLIEEYWVDEWDTVASDLREMRALGANIVRIHLSFAPFLDSPDAPNAKNVAQLRKLVRVCEDLGIYLDVTGLGSYRKESAPAWYVNTTEAQRWAIQAKFWDVVADACGDSPAIACYDLVNEPVVPGEARKPGEWMAGHLGPFWYSQFITLDPASRERGEIALAWVRQMSAAIRRHDRDALITVGMLPFTSSPGQSSIGFDPPGLKDVLDLICVHVYPKPPPFAEALSVVERFDCCGKPLIIEETFPLQCKPQDMPAFIEATKKHADGWLGFYWGQTADELKSSTRPHDVMMRQWLELFQSARPRAIDVSTDRPNGD